MLADIPDHWTCPLLRCVDAPARVLAALGMQSLAVRWEDGPGCWLWNRLCALQGPYYRRMLGIEED